MKVCSCVSTWPNWIATHTAFVHFQLFILSCGDPVKEMSHCFFDSIYLHHHPPPPPFAAHLNLSIWKALKMTMVYPCLFSPCLCVSPFLKGTITLVSVFKWGAFLLRWSSLESNEWQALVASCWFLPLICFMH